MIDRELTTLEYIVLGLISLQPQSGYDVVSYFESGAYSWSASPGSIYPMLKRLEKQRVILGELEIQYETRPRKVYHLQESGAKLLDAWLAQIPKMRPFYSEREIALMKFQFMEARFTPQAILDWLNAYADAIHYAESASKLYQAGIYQAIKDEEATDSLHADLLMQAYMMEISTLRTWLDMACTRLRQKHNLA